MEKIRTLHNFLLVALRTANPPIPSLHATHPPPFNIGGPPEPLEPTSRRPRAHKKKSHTNQTSTKHETHTTNTHTHRPKRLKSHTHTHTQKNSMPRQQLHNTPSPPPSRAQPTSDSKRRKPNPAGTESMTSRSGAETRKRTRSETLAAEKSHREGLRAAPELTLGNASTSENANTLGEKSETISHVRQNDGSPSVSERKV